MNNNRTNLELTIFIIMIILSFCMLLDNQHNDPKLFQGLTKATRRVSIYPSLQYEKHSQITMLVEINGALPKQGKELSGLCNF